MRAYPRLVLAIVLTLGLALAAGCASDPAPRPEPRPAEAALHAEAAFNEALRLAAESRKIDERAIRGQMDALTAEAGALAAEQEGSAEKAERIARVFFGRYSFGADPDDLAGVKPETFDVAAVIERRRGACLPLAIVIAKGASGAGVVAGVARAPGHALVAIGPPSDRVYIDPSARGRVIDWSEAVRTWPWSPRAANLYDGRPLRSEEVIALWRANRAALRIAAGDLAGAEADLEAARAVEKDLPEALVNLAALRIKQGELSEAEGLLERAEELVPRNAAVQFNLGLVAAARGDATGAIRRYGAALEADPSHAAARANKAALEKRGK